MPSKTYFPSHPASLSFYPQKTFGKRKVSIVIKIALGRRGEFFVLVFLLCCLLEMKLKHSPLRLYLRGAGKVEIEGTVSKMEEA